MTLAARALSHYDYPLNAGTFWKLCPPQPPPQPQPPSFLPKYTPPLTCIPSLFRDHLCSVSEGRVGWWGTRVRCCWAMLQINVWINYLINEWLDWNHRRKTKDVNLTEHVEEKEGSAGGGEQMFSCFSLETYDFKIQEEPSFDWFQRKAALKLRGKVWERSWRKSDLLVFQLKFFFYSREEKKTAPLLKQWFMTCYS